jgi:exodeoxyribonuclease VII small subunit
MGPMTGPEVDSSRDFEAALQRLEEIVKTLEDGELALDNALDLFEEGVRLSRLCHGKLEKAERRVELLLKEGAGDFKRVQFDEAADPAEDRE